MPLWRARLAPNLILHHLLLIKLMVHMSVYVQMEEGCEVATADEVATVVHQIFAYAAGACC